MAYRAGGKGRRSPGEPVVLTSMSKLSKLDTYWSEARCIRENSISVSSLEEETEDATLEDSEQDPSLWLKQVGMSNIVHQMESGDASMDTSLEYNTDGLPKAHAAAIRKRVDTLRSTLRRARREPRRYQQPLPRVKRKPVPTDLHIPSSPSSSSPSPSPSPSHPSSSSPSSSTTTTTVPSYTHKMNRISSGVRLVVESPEPTEQQDIKLMFKSPMQEPLNPLPSAANGCNDSLPSFSLITDRLGLTHTDDLSPGDCERVQMLALLELTVTLESQGIPLRTLRPAKAKNNSSNECALFGVSLSALMHNDLKRNPKATIPLVFSEMVHYLERHGVGEEGILRVPGSTSRIAAIKEDMEATFSSGRFSFEGRKVSDVASLFKLFLRDLPVPLLTRQYLPVFASIPDIEDLREQVRTLNLLVLLLPPLHQRVLKRLVEFCANVSDPAQENRMDLTNTAMVIAPNLFFSLPAQQSFDDITMAAKTTAVIRLLIHYHQLLWIVPSQMITQVRTLYEAAVKRLSQKNVQKALKQMSSGHLETGKKSAQLQQKSSSLDNDHSNIIRVRAPLFTRVCMAVDVVDQLTAGDIVQKLRKRSHINRDVIRKRFSHNLEPTPSAPVSSGARAVQGSGASVNGQGNLQKHQQDAGPLLRPDSIEQFLFEVGGNIGERCLDDSADMRTLCRVNPHAQWIIKPRDCPDLS